jgi:LPXTG-motif cell wall-anchored protein
MAVVLGLVLIGALAFFLLRRRRRNARGGHAASDGMARKSELDAEKPVPAPVHAGDANVKPYAQPSELSAVSRPQELPANDRERDRLAKVDDRAAAGYEGAYRGN